MLLIPASGSDRNASTTDPSSFLATCLYRSSFCTVFSQAEHRSGVKRREAWISFAVSVTQGSHNECSAHRFHRCAFLILLAGYVSIKDMIKGGLWFNFIGIILVSVIFLVLSPQLPAAVVLKLRTTSVETIAGEMIFRGDDGSIILSSDAVFHPEGEFEVDGEGISFAVQGARLRLRSSP